MSGGMSIEMWLAERDGAGSELLRRVWDELARQSGLDTSAVRVTVTGRTVTLSGAVPDRPARITAERAARSVSEVESVTNELVVIRG